MTHTYIRVQRTTPGGRTKAFLGRTMRGSEAVSIIAEFNTISELDQIVFTLNGAHARQIIEQEITRRPRERL